MWEGGREGGGEGAISLGIPGPVLLLNNKYVPAVPPGQSSALQSPIGCEISRPPQPRGTANLQHRHGDLRRGEGGEGGGGEVWPGS